MWQHIDLTPKPHPEHIAQVCKNGHLVLSSLKCPKCHWPIEGIGPYAWMGGGGPHKPPRYCEECGQAFPWTEATLATARHYTDDIDQLTPEEKAELKETFPDLASDTPRTALAVSRFKRFVTKAGPVAGSSLLKIIESVLTEAVKRSIGL